MKLMRFNLRGLTSPAEINRG